MQRRHLLLPLAALRAQNAAVHDVGVRKQLFLDTKFIESSAGVTLTVNPPTRTGEKLVTAGSPWEKGMHLGSYSSVLGENGKVRLWYDVRDDAKRPGQNPDVMCVAYAESSDGLHFTKPVLGQVTHRGSRQNNFVMPADPAAMALGGCSVMLDENPACPPAERYKSWQKIYPKPGSGIAGPHRVFVSPDGLRWRLSDKLVTGLRAADTQPTWFWDRRLRRYVGYSREWIIFAGEQNIRMVSYNESADGFAWRNPHLVLAPDEADFTAASRPRVDFSTMTLRGERLVEHPDAARARRPTPGKWDTNSTADQVPDPGAPLDIYGPGITPYEDAYVALFSQFHHWGAAHEGPDTGDIGLALSRDGRHFHRPGSRQPFLRLGPAGAFDSAWIWALPRPVRMGSELWIYYLGSNARHGGAAPARLETAISRAVLRLDGFVSADFAYTGGTLLTPLIRFQGRRLELNLDTSGGGVSRVALLDEEGRELPGFSLREADPLNGNQVGLPVTWRGRSDVSAIAGRPVRLLVEGRNAKLYAFQFTGA